jgi:hypothetical protein
MQSTNEIWVVDPATLDVKKKIPVPRPIRAAAAPALSLAFIAVASKGSKGALAERNPDLSVVDLKTGKSVGEYTPKQFKQFNCFQGPLVTPDGKYLIAEGSPDLYRFGVKGAELEMQEFSRAGGRFNPSARLEVSDDSKFVCTPEYGGNNGAGGGVHVYAVEDLKTPAFSLRPKGGGFTCMAFDSAAGRIYSFMRVQGGISVHNNVGRVESDHPMNLPPGPSATTMAVHPKGRKLILMDNNQLYYMELEGTSVAKKEDMPDKDKVAVGPKDKLPDKDKVKPSVEPKPGTPEDKPPDEWQSFIAQKDAFAVWFPKNGTVVEKRDTVAVKISGRPQSFLVDIATFTREDKSIFIAARLVVPTDLLKGSNVLDRYKMYRDMFADELNGNITSEQQIVKDNKLVGMDYAIKTPKGMARMRIYGASTIAYRALVIGTNQQVTSKDADTFLDSFKTSVPMKAP